MFNTHISFAGFPQRKIAAVGAGFITLTGAFSWAQQDTYLRLTGYRENNRELSRYGIPQRELVRITKKRAQNLVNFGTATSTDNNSNE
jgi:hypothetical protein